jgi:hypothetical protein
MKILKNVMAYFTSVAAIVSLAIPLMAPVAVNAQTASGLCYVFTQNLGDGRPLSSQDAAALTQALTDAGVWTSGTSITTYNDAVASAVSGFQEKYAAQILTPNGLSYGTGFVGASTRNELNSIYGGCGSPSNPTQPTQCPAGFTCTPIGQAPVCPAGWTCTPITTNPTTPTNPSTQSVPTISSVQSPAESPNILHPGEWANVYGTNLQNGVTVVVAGQSVSVDNPYTSSLRFTVPSSLPAGTATLYVTNSAGTSNSISVTISTPSTPSATAPTITRISAPASPDSQVYTGEKFAIQGTNFVMPDSVYVGNESATVTQDGNWPTGGVLYATAPSDLQSGSSYVYIKNANGTSNQIPVTITGQTSSATQSPFTVTFPTVGATLQIGQTYGITWYGTDNESVTSYAVYLVDGPLGSNGSVFLGTAYLPANAGMGGATPTFQWTIPSTVQQGSGYQIQFSGAGVTGGNSPSFTII